MKTFKIAKKSNQVVSSVPLNFISGGTSGNDLYIVVKREEGIGLNEGGKLLLEKTASGSSGQMMKVYEEETTIKAIVDADEFSYIYFDYVYIKPLTLVSFLKIEHEPEAEDPYNFKLYFTGEHHMLPCDIDEEYKIYIRRGERVIEFSDLAFCFPISLVKAVDIEPEYNNETCCDDVVKRFNYETMERNSILARVSGITAVDEFEPEPGDEVLFSTNPFFKIDTEGKINFYGCDGEVVTISKYTDFMGLGVVMEQDYDAKRMFQEYQVNELFVNKIKNSIIPPIIDLEKLKYAPSFLSGETTNLATGLTFNLHFRTRVSGTTDSDVPSYEAKYYFKDTWHFDDTMDTWNGNGAGKPGITSGQLYSDEEFVNSSNLIGFLDFTDDDIYNQKNRVKQSFIRLSFYDSKNPLTQSLLCYSTIFFDSGDLYGKYVKRKAWLEEVIGGYDPKKYPVVWSSASTKDPCSAITSQLMVNDEYDMTKSGEGFNIYLFKEDAPVELYNPEDPENTSIPIYMKVEFNHAGNGRTIPMIRWPKTNDGSPEPLTIANYLDNLYIELRISLTDKGYVYHFPKAVSADDESNGGRKNGIVWEDERLVFNLFEPMIQPEILE